MAEQVATEGPSSRGQPSRDSDLEKASARRRQAEHLTEEAVELWHKVADKARKPTIGATIAGIAVLAAGAVWGATEAAVAAVAAYAVFRMLRKGNSKEGREDAGEEHDGHGSVAAT